MPSLTVTDNLYAWTLTLDGGEERVVLGSSLQTVIGNAPNVVSAVRGPAFTADRPVPVLSLLVPDTAALGSPNFTLSVQGTDFLNGDVIVWNNGVEPTTYVSATELTTLVDMTSAIMPLDVPVKVRTLTGRESNVLTFIITLTELQQTQREGE